MREAERIALEMYQRCAEELAVAQAELATLREKAASAKQFMTVMKCGHMQNYQRPNPDTSSFTCSICEIYIEKARAKIAEAERDAANETASQQAATADALWEVICRVDPSPDKDIVVCLESLAAQKESWECNYGIEKARAERAEAENKQLREKAGMSSYWERCAECNWTALVNMGEKLTEYRCVLEQARDALRAQYESTGGCKCAACDQAHEALAACDALLDEPRETAEVPDISQAQDPDLGSFRD